jgi:predicted sugar kinase
MEQHLEVAKSSDDFLWIQLSLISEVSDTMEQMTYSECISSMGRSIIMLANNHTSTSTQKTNSDRLVSHLAPMLDLDEGKTAGEATEE